MIKDNKIWVANNECGEPLLIRPEMANRHGLIAGATGTGKTVTVKVLAESFSDLGVPVFLADVKGDLAGMIKAGEESEDMQERINRFALNEVFSYTAYPSAFWDIYSQSGVPLRTTVSEIGPLLLSRILDLNDLQSDILSIIFRIADDRQLLLIDTKDLKAMLHYVDENSNEFAVEYGKISSASVGAIVRAIVALETAGGGIFFGEPALNINDWICTDVSGKGMINILDSSSLINSPRLYSTFLLWMMSELFESLPEVGDMSKPKMVFFFDEAHLLFNDAPKPLLDKIEQVVKLIRSKGVGIYFCTQNPRDIPDGVLAQLGNKIEHALRGYTPAEQKAIKAAAESFRANPDFDTYDVITTLGTGEAIVSFLDEEGIPTIVEKGFILPPQSRMGTISDAERNEAVKASLYYNKYAEAYDPDSAFEFLQRKGIADREAAEAMKLEAERLKEEERIAKAEAKEAEKLVKAEEREKAKAEAKAEKEAAKAEEKAKKQKQKAAKQVGSTVAGTVGREVGKQFGKQFGSFGKTLGGNVGASLGRGLLSTLFKN